MSSRPMKDEKPCANAAPTSASCRYRGARARARSSRSHGPCGWIPVSLAVELFALRLGRAFPVAIRIGAVSAQRHPRAVPDELDRPPPKRRPASADPACSRGARPADDPGPFDRCLQLTIVFSKNDCPSSRHTPHRISPRGAGALGTRRAARFGGPVRTCGACSSPSPRTGVPLTPRRFAGFPGRALCVRQRRPADRLSTIPGSYPRA